MLINRSAITVFLGACLTACSSSPLTIAPPRVTYGGRAVSIAVRHDNDKRIVVAAETGGLFRTFDGGLSWQHLNNLPNNHTADVAFASLAPDVIIATTWSQYRTVSDGGIWRSTDGGGSWSQPTGWAPPPSTKCPSRPNAYGISHIPLTRTFYVGTDCGLAVSNDNGATWSYIVLEPTISRWDSAYNRVRAVLVLNRTAGVLARERELWRLTPNGSWTKVDSLPPTPTWRLPPIHSLASPYWTGSSSIFFYVTGDRTVWVSSDAGMTWSQRPSPSADLREGFVRIARPLSGRDATEFDVYYGDGMKLHRQTFKISGLTGSGSWKNLPSDHDDPSDIAFDVDHRVPVLLASDGGVHRTSDKGAHWKLTGGGYGGYTALQITEVTGQVVSGSKPHLDLYYVSHDDDFKASPDGGATWPGYKCCEGKNIRIQPTSVDHQGSRFTGLACGPCSIFATGAHLANETFWPSAPSGHANNLADAPFPIVGDAYLQSVADTGSSTVSNFYLTLSAGAAWSKAFSLSRPLVGPPLFAGSPANPTIFQGIQRLGTLPSGVKIYGLMRARNIAGQAVVVPADSMGMVAIGSNKTTNATLLVVGVDPQNANHLIASDVGTSEMKFSADAGLRWFPLPQLTSAVTESGKYLFQLVERSFASTIAWDPYDSCHILVGTHQNGIIRSTDGGNSWAKIPGSHHATDVSWFYFPPTGTIWVASDGRGLWNLSVERKTGSAANGCRFPVPLAGLPIIDNPTLARTRQASVFVTNPSRIGVLSEVEPGALVRVIGSNFIPSSRSGQPVRILFDHEVVSRAVQVRGDSSFSIDIPANRPPGEVLVTVEQPASDRLITAATSIDVRTHDRRQRQ